MSTPTDADPGYTQCSVTDPVEPEAEAEDLRWPEVWSECVKDASEQGCTPEWLLYQRIRAAQHAATREACARTLERSGGIGWGYAQDVIYAVPLEDAPCPKVNERDREEELDDSPEGRLRYWLDNAVTSSDRDALADAARDVLAKLATIHAEQHAATREACADFLRREMDNGSYWAERLTRLELEDAS